MRTHPSLVTTLVMGVMSEQHILLDSSKDSMWEWFKYPKGPGAPTPGDSTTFIIVWMIDIFLSFTGFLSVNFINTEGGVDPESVVACDIGYHEGDVNNLMWTPFIERGEASRIYVEVDIQDNNW